MFGRRKKASEKPVENKTVVVAEEEKAEEKSKYSDSEYSKNIEMGSVSLSHSRSEKEINQNTEELSPVHEEKVVEPDNIIDVDIMQVKNLQIGYQAETIFMKKSDDDQLHIHEYIGYDAYEYLGKVTANRFKTTIRYGRRENVNRETYVEVYIPDKWQGEFSISSQYGHITSDDNWQFERLTAETNEGNITLKKIEAPRIRLVSPNGSILVEHAIGFTDLHCMTGAIVAHRIDGGAKLETSTGPIEANFTSTNNLLECNTLSGDIHLTLPDDQDLKIDGISKRGMIQTDIEGLSVVQKPGNVQHIAGVIGEKPRYEVRISTINGNITLD